jgi:hypothetical protein
MLYIYAEFTDLIVENNSKLNLMEKGQTRHNTTKVIELQ